MYCTYCGANLGRDAVFCLACGRRNDHVPVTHGRTVTMWAALAVLAVLVLAVAGASGPRSTPATTPRPTNS